VLSSYVVLIVLVIPDSLFSSAIEVASYSTVPVCTTLIGVGMGKDDMEAL
jgi:hypothetical protein